MTASSDHGRAEGLNAVSDSCGDRKLPMIAGTRQSAMCTRDRCSNQNTARAGRARRRLSVTHIACCRLGCRAGIHRSHTANEREQIERQAKLISCFKVRTFRFSVVSPIFLRRSYRYKNVALCFTTHGPKWPVIESRRLKKKKREKASKICSSQRLS